MTLGRQMVGLSALTTTWRVLGQASTCEKGLCYLYLMPWYCPFCFMEVKPGCFPVPWSLVLMPFIGYKWAGPGVRSTVTPWGRQRTCSLHNLGLLTLALQHLARFSMDNSAHQVVSSLDNLGWRRTVRQAGKSWLWQIDLTCPKNTEVGWGPAWGLGAKGECGSPVNIDWLIGSLGSTLLILCLC